MAEEEELQRVAKRARTHGGDAALDGSAPQSEPDAAQRQAGGAGPAEPMAVDKRFERENFLEKQEADGELRFLVIRNDLVEQHSIWLVDLKNIYAKQLPNMPKDYIVRLVFDPNHKSLVALKDGVVIGGITYRVFERQQLSEVAFCAVSASEQVKGYGTRLMNKLKLYNKEHENVTHLITFADNNAVGYFQKQGFSKEILLEREKWAGYIKEYDGGTLMESILAVGTLPADFPRVIRAQREAVEAKIREMTNSDTIYPGLAAFREGGARRAGDIFAPVAPDSIPGVREAGWTPMPMRFRIVLPGCGDGTPTRANLHRFMRAIHTMVTEHADGWPFLEPVDGEEVTDYYEIVKEPIDLRLILERIEAGDYYITLEIFAADFRRMFQNCRIYNAPDTPYFKCSNRLEAFFETKIAASISWSKRSGPLIAGAAGCTAVV